MGILDKAFKNVVKVEVVPQYGYFDLIVSLATLLVVLYIARIYTHDKRLLAIIGITTALLVFGII